MKITSEQINAIILAMKEIATAAASDATADPSESYASDMYYAEDRAKEILIKAFEE